MLSIYKTEARLAPYIICIISHPPASSYRQVVKVFPTLPQAHRSVVNVLNNGLVAFIDQFCQLRPPADVMHCLVKWATCLWLSRWVQCALWWDGSKLINFESFARFSLLFFYQQVFIRDHRLISFSFSFFLFPALRNRTVWRIQW